MKIRLGFVSNSSSSSFIVGIRVKDEHAHLLDILSDTMPLPDARVVSDICKAAQCDIPGAVNYIVDRSQEINRYIKKNFDYDGNYNTVTKIYGSRVNAVIENNKNMIFYLVRVSDEMGGVGADLRMKIGSMCDLEGENFITMYVEE